MPSLLENTDLFSPKTLNFHIKKDAWYVIEVSAKVKSKAQRGKKETDDEELLVKIDDKTFPKLNSSQALFNSPASFSGGALHNNEKTIYFFLNLGVGDHSINLRPQHSAEIIKVSYNEIDILDNSLLFNLDKQSTDRDRKPWITFVLVNFPIVTFSINAFIKWHWFDGDDIKVIVNNKVQSKRNSIFRKDWAFTAKPIIDIFGREQSETFVPNVSDNSLVYIELIADKTPILRSITFEIENFSQNLKTLQHYTAGSNGEDYNKYDKDINNAVSYWNNIFLGQDYPPPNKLDPNLVKAMVYIESSMGYFKTSDEFYPAYPDVMQIADLRNPAIHTLKNDGWIEPSTQSVAKEYEWTPSGVREVDYRNEANGDSPEESIKWGVRWLYHKAQGVTKNNKRYWNPWNVAVRDYNGLGNTKYESEVYDVYKNGIDNRDKSHNLQLWTLIILFSTFTGILGYVFNKSLQQNNGNVLSASTIKVSQESVLEKVTRLMHEKLEVYKLGNVGNYSELFSEPFTLCKNNGNCFPELVFSSYISDLISNAKSFKQFEDTALFLEIIHKGDFVYGDIDNDGVVEMVIIVPDYLNRAFSQLYVVELKGSNLNLVTKTLDPGYLGSPNSETDNRTVQLTNLTNDDTPEILVFLSSGRWGSRLHIFRYSQGLINQLVILGQSFLYPKFTFEDKNNDQVPEVYIKGEKFGLMGFSFECNACLHVYVSETYEYQPNTNLFELMSKNYSGVAGAFADFLEDVKVIGFTHPLFNNWSLGEKERFEYTLSQLQENGVSSLFESESKQYLNLDKNNQVIVDLRRSLKLADLVVREEPIKTTEQRLWYSTHSPEYRVVIKRLNSDIWQVTEFNEVSEDISLD